MVEGPLSSTFPSYLLYRVKSHSAEESGKPAVAISFARNKYEAMHQ